MGAGDLLVVDDEEFLRDAVATFLSSLGFTGTSAGTGTQALRAARSRQFDLLILDIMLPDLDGFEIVGRRCQQGSRIVSAAFAGLRLRLTGCVVPGIYTFADDGL